MINPLCKNSKVLNKNVVSKNDELQIFYFKDYEIEVEKTRLYPNPESNLEYPVLGLNEEVQVVANKLQENIHNKSSVISQQEREKMLDDCGNILWYLSTTAYELQSSLPQLAIQNSKKVLIFF